MRNYIILNGNNSNTISGLLIQSLPPISKPLMRTAIEEIDGRDGDIVTNLGYSAYDKEISIGLYGSYDVDAVIKYFNDNMTGQVTFSNEPDKYYNYEIINQIDFERLIRFKTAIVTLHCQPFKYPTEETPVEIEIQNITNEAEEMDLNNTANAPMKLELKGNTSQASEPTPDSPVDVNVVSGDNTIEICGKNLFDKNSFTYASGFYDDNGVLQSSTGTGHSTNYINVNEYTTYTISGFSLAYLDNAIYTIRRIYYWDSSKRWISRSTDITPTSKTFTPPTNCKYITLQVSIDTGAGHYKNIFDDLDTIQIEQNTEATTYEAYTGNTQLISLGVENLFDKDNANVINAYINSSGKILNDNDNRTIWLQIDKNTNYTFQMKQKALSTSSSTDYVRIALCETQPTGDLVGTLVYSQYRTSATEDYYYENTFNSGNNSYVAIRVAQTERTDYNTSIETLQLEKGSKANSYSEYGTTPIELCKIGTYQDYFYKSSGKWYLHKEIGKVVLDGTENWTKVNNVFQILTVYPSDVALRTDTDFAKSNYYEYGYVASSITNLLPNNKFSWSGGKSLTIRNDSCIDDTAFKTWLQSHNTIIYYPLATSTDTEITDSTLISQLNNLANVNSYDPITHITQNSNNKPFMLNATAVQKGTDTATVDNDGNIYSKPTLDIEGNGIVGIYLNGNQMFSVDLSSSNECVIDITNLEAYDPSTNTLMNRQVTGDYSNFTLPVGESTVKVSSNVTKATITNYTRWL